jgi:hypothetical protein
MSFYKKKVEKREVEITKEEWQELEKAFRELMEDMDDYRYRGDKTTQNLAGELAKVIYKLAKKGNWF